jgi:hypothetical protein
MVFLSGQFLVKTEIPAQTTTTIGKVGEFIVPPVNVAFLMQNDHHISTYSWIKNSREVCVYAKEAIPVGTYATFLAFYRKADTE